MKNKKLNKYLLRIPIYLFTILFVILPLAYMVLISFLTKAKTWGFDFTFTLENYKKVFDPFYLNIFLESVKLALASTVLVTLIGYPFGYFMGRLGEKWKRRMMMLLMIPFWTSGLIRLNGWIIIFRSNGVLDKLLMFLSITKTPLKLLYTYPAVLVGMVYFLLPFMILSVYASVEEMDWSLIEASRDLGASRLESFITITLRLTMPGLLSGVVLTFVPSMGLFYISDILGGNKIVLIGSVIVEQLTKLRNIPFAAALSVILMLLTIVFLRLYRKVSGTGELEGLF